MRPFLLVRPLTSDPASRAPTQPCPVILTPAPPCLAVPNPDTPVSSTPPTSVSFGLGIVEALQYLNLAQAPYPPPAISEVDDLAETATATAEDICHAASRQAFVAYKHGYLIWPTN